MEERETDGDVDKAVDNVMVCQALERLNQALN